MSTVHLAKSKKWLPAIRAKITEIEKLAYEWHAWEKQRAEVAKKYDADQNADYKRRCEENAAASAEWLALPWWKRRKRRNPALEFLSPPVPEFVCYNPFPLDNVIRDLHSLEAPVALNLPLDVDTAVAAHFLNTETLRP